MKYIGVFGQGYKKDKRFSHQLDNVSRTIQDCVVDIPTIFAQFNGTLSDLFNKYNNGLLFESEIGVFVDELNEKEVAAFKEFTEKQAAAEALRLENEKLFDEWKAERAAAVLAARNKPTPPSPEPSSPEPSSGE